MDTPTALIQELYGLGAEASVWSVAAGLALRLGMIGTITTRHII